jgi:hypothetical protein
MCIHTSKRTFIYLCIHIHAQKEYLQENTTHVCTCIQVNEYPHICSYLYVHGIRKLRMYLHTRKYRNIYIYVNAHTCIHAHEEHLHRDEARVCIQIRIKQYTHNCEYVYMHRKSTCTVTKRVYVYKYE